MSMYTRCPKCRTTFAVTNDQLEARGGVVRCGNCHHVFRADQHLMKSIPQTRANGQKQEEPDTTAKVAKPEKITAKTSRPLPTLEELLWGKKRSRIKPFFWGIGNVLVLTILAIQITYFTAPKWGATQICDLMCCAFVRLSAVLFSHKLMPG